MKKILLGFLFASLSLFGFSASGDTIWVDAIDGSDAYTTQTKAQAIQTLTKLQDVIDTMTVGKPIAISDTAYYVTEPITFLNKTGTSGSPFKLVTWNKYGNGRAKIKGMKLLTGWTSLGANLYQKIDSDLPSTETVSIEGLYTWNYILNGILVDGVWRNIATTPETGYYDIESWAGNGKDYVIDSDAPLVSGLYNGAHAYIYMSGAEWYADKAEIISNNSTTLYLSSSEVYGTYGLYQNWSDGINPKYKIINVTPYVEFTWRYTYSSHDLTILSNTNPSGHTIYAPVGNYLIDIDNSDYVTIDGVEFWGGNVYQIYIQDGSDNITLENNKHYYSGHSAVMCSYSNSITIENDTIQDGNLNGITNIAGLDGSSFIVNGNTIKDMGEFKYYADGEQGYIGIDGIYNESDLWLDYNHIDNVGYNGISFTTSTESYYNDGTIECYGNLVENFCTHLADGAAIYFGNHNDNIEKIIRKNIILHQGTDGTFNYSGYQTQVMGIYLDGYVASSYFTIDSNSIYEVQMPIFLQHTSRYCDINTNTLVGYSPDTYNTLYSSGFYHRENGTDNILFDHNLCVSTDSLSMNFLWRYATTHSSTGNTIDYNKYFNPFNNTNRVVCGYNQVDYSYYRRTVAEQYSAWGYDQHSTGNQTSYYHYEVECDDDDFVQLFTNWSSTSHNFGLGNCSFQDTSGTVLSGTINVDPYMSKVLFYVSGNLNTVDYSFYEGSSTPPTPGPEYGGLIGLHSLQIKGNLRTIRKSGRDFYYGVGIPAGEGSPIANLADSLISWYSFEGNANDMHGLNHGTVYNALNQLVGGWEQGYCYSFDGTSDYIDLPAILLTGDETGSISVWARSLGTGCTYDMIVDRYAQTDCIWITSDGTWAALLNETTAYYGIAHDNDWHHFVLTYEGTAGSAQVKLYMDGVLYATATETDDWLREGQVWRIGGNTNSSSSYWWNGYIDSVGFFSHTLSGAQVLELYDSGAGVYYYGGEFYNY